MPTIVHFIDVGEGNMTLLELDDGEIALYDCNVTDENEDRVLSYVGNAIGWSSHIDMFINSHRDVDHLRGVRKVHDYFPIQEVWESGVTGTTPSSAPYQEYMRLRREVGFYEVPPRKYWDHGRSRIRVWNSKNDDLPNNPNSQSIVIKLEHKDTMAGSTLRSVFLTGDSDAITWKDIRTHYNRDDYSVDILLASHHGALSFFDDPNDTQHYFTEHIRDMSPAMTIISVGPNSYGHPDSKAMEFYEKNSRGSDRGNKVFTTQDQGTMKLILNDDGGWVLSPRQ